MRASVAMQNSNNKTAVATLCPECGFCCNGIIFSDVKLRPCDLKAVAASGLSVRKNRLVQPCPAFDGKLCRMYAQRPGPCREFNCLLVQQMEVGTLRAPEALRHIRAAKALVNAVESILAELGQTDTALPLSHRFSNVMAEPLDLSGDDRVLRLRRQLATAVDKLARRLARDFVADNKRRRERLRSIHQAQTLLTKEYGIAPSERLRHDQARHDVE